MQRTLMVNNQSISYQVSGSGSAVMLLHGFGEDSRVWEGVAPVLEKNFRLIIPDLPGSGQSGLTDDVSMEGMAHVMRQVLDDAGVDTCAMVGHSMGGYVTLAFAELYPQRLKAFGLFHSSAYADGEEKKAARRRGIAFIGENGPVKFLEQANRNLFSEEFRKKNPAVVQDFIDRFTNFPAQSLVRYYEAMMQRPDRTRVLREFTGPVMFIIGKYDNAVPADQVLEQCHLPRLAYIQLLMHSGHLGMIEEAATSTAFLEKFLVDSALSPA
jgi:Predicted hydrolases or acyltransferases (alpha/beta hydrolase superfamily)